MLCVHAQREVTSGLGFEALSMWVSVLWTHLFLTVREPMQDLAPGEVSSQDI